MNSPDSEGLKLNAQFGKPEKYIGPGDFYSSGEDIVISTLLGSCIAVALSDQKKAVGGLNHFMLPSPKIPQDNDSFAASKYGVNAMELLINDILKKGGEKRNLRAKVFGGSTVFTQAREATYDIPKMNIEFVFGFLSMERIPVDSYSVGGTLPRKVIFLPREGRAFMKFTKTFAAGLSKRDTSYSQALREVTENEGRPILF